MAWMREMAPQRIFLFRGHTYTPRHSRQTCLHCAYSLHWKPTTFQFQRLESIRKYDFMIVWVVNSLKVGKFFTSLIWSFLARDSKTENYPFFNLSLKVVTTTTMLKLLRSLTESTAVNWSSSKVAFGWLGLSCSASSSGFAYCIMRLGF